MAKFYIMHAGIKGMKWGVRRYQNPDGTLTPAGKKRYKNNVSEDYARAHDKKSVKSMSDKELRERNNRLQMEQQYKNLTKKKGIGKKAIQAYIAGGTLIAGVATATAAYGKFGQKALDKAYPKIADWVLKGINMSGPFTK